MTQPSPEPCRLILASGSPRRRELLDRLGFAFTVRPVVIDESPQDGESPSEYVLRLARAKAQAIAEPGELVLAADTVVVEGETLLGKPRDPADARRMLRRLSGKEHTVVTGVALCDRQRALQVAVVESTLVRFAELSEEEIAWYVETGEPLDKAGAYAVQGLGALFVEAIDGNYSNVVGLPLPATYRLLRHARYAFPNLPERREEEDGDPPQGGKGKA
ncbi:MAG: septum formation inhibitor Maf [bacterium]|nr:septum formation inhibitor Maf [bacterium]